MLKYEELLNKKWWSEVHTNFTSFGTQLDDGRFIEIIYEPDPNYAWYKKRYLFLESSDGDTILYYDSLIINEFGKLSDHLEYNSDKDPFLHDKAIDCMEIMYGNDDVEVKIQELDKKDKDNLRSLLFFRLKI